MCGMEEEVLLALLDEAGLVHVDNCELWEQMRRKQEELWVSRPPSVARSFWKRQL